MAAWSHNAHHGQCTTWSDQPPEWVRRSVPLLVVQKDTPPPMEHLQCVLAARSERFLGLADAEC